MSYPLPTELRERIYQAIDAARIPVGMQDALYGELSKLMVRENRLVRQEILELRQVFLDAAEHEEADYGSSVCAHAGEAACGHISTEILKPRVYYNTERERAEYKERQDFIDKIFGDDPSAED